MLVVGHPLFEMMGFEVVTLENGVAKAKVSFDKALCDAAGALHRGVLVVLADTACGMATLARLDECLPIATVDLRVDYAVSIPPGFGLEASIECHHIGRGAVHSNGVVRALNADGKLSATVVRIADVFAVDTPGQYVDIANGGGK